MFVNSLLDIQNNQLIFLHTQVTGASRRKIYMCNTLDSKEIHFLKRKKRDMQVASG